MQAKLYNYADNSMSHAAYALKLYVHRDDSRFAPSQWETSLQSKPNISPVSAWELSMTETLPLAGLSRMEWKSNLAKWWLFFPTLLNKYY